MVEMSEILSELIKQLDFYTLPSTLWSLNIDPNQKFVVANHVCPQSTSNFQILIDKQIFVHYNFQKQVVECVVFINQKIVSALKILNLKTDLFCASDFFELIFKVDKMKICTNAKRDDFCLLLVSDSKTDNCAKCQSIANAAVAALAQPISSENFPLFDSTEMVDDFLDRTFHDDNRPLLTPQHHHQHQHQHQHHHQNQQQQQQQHTHSDDILLPLTPMLNEFLPLDTLDTIDCDLVIDSSVDIVDGHNNFQNNQNDEGSDDVDDEDEDEVSDCDNGNDEPEEVAAMQNTVALHQIHPSSLLTTSSLSLHVHPSQPPPRLQQPPPPQPLPPQPQPSHLTAMSSNDFLDNDSITIDSKIDTINKFNEPFPSLPSTVCAQSTINHEDLLQSSEFPEESGGIIVKLFNCPKCSRKFTRRKILKNHLKKHEKKNLCPICGLVLAPTTRLSRHLKIHQKSEEKASRLINKPGEKINLVDSFLSFECDLCSEIFDNENGLKVHRSVMHESKDQLLQKIKCDVCNKLFSSRQNLRTHMLTIHSVERPYKCFLCEKGFIYPRSLKAHMRIHTNEKPFSCPFCDKDLRTKEHLKVHLRIHTGSRPFTCEFCLKTFTTSGNLGVHLKTHDIEPQP